MLIIVRHARATKPPLVLGCLTKDAFNIAGRIRGPFLISSLSPAEKGSEKETGKPAFRLAFHFISLRSFVCRTKGAFNLVVNHQELLLLRNSALFEELWKDNSHIFLLLQGIERWAQ